MRRSPKGGPLDPVGPAPLCSRVQAADGYVVVHPNWWASRRRSLKVGLDRVLRQGVGDEFGPGGVVELLPRQQGPGAGAFQHACDDEMASSAIHWRTCGRTASSVFGGVKDFRRRNFESDHSQHARAARRVARGSCRTGGREFPSDHASGGTPSGTDRAPR